MAEKKEKIHISSNTASAFEKGRELISEADLSCATGLPICALWDELVQSVREHQVLIVSGETGSGKTTQLPKICLLANRGTKGRIVCTQPRRVAAVTVASRLSEELGRSGPSLVGYKIRFRDRTGPFTRVQFVTDGLLLAELHRDRLLRRYDTVIVDEAHERSLNIDILLGTLRKILKKRKDLKIIVTSATLDIERFKQAFPEAPHIEVTGRSFPVDIYYNPPEDSPDEQSIVEQVVSAVKNIRTMDTKRDILVFLPTERDIHEAVKALDGLLGKEALVLPMYGRLAGADQQRIFRPGRLQKIVVATNVAETSITVPGICYVVDSGLARISRYNVRSRTKALPVSTISRASADQRAGRAGRLEPGVCIRLYSEEDYLNRSQYTPPEILRSNLAEVILRLEAIGLGPIQDFPFVDPPSPQAVKEGYATLKELGALTPRGRLTSLGKLMARLPLDPRISRIVIQARREKALREIIVIAAALSIQDPRERPADKETQADQAHRIFLDPASDFITYLKIWNALEDVTRQGASRSAFRKFCKKHFLSYNRVQEWRDIYDQILLILKENGGFPLNRQPADYERIHRAVLSGFLGNVAIKQEGARYLGTRGKELYLFPGSGTYRKKPSWIVAAELVRTSRLYARTVAAIKPEWIEDLAGDLVTRAYSEPHWEKNRGEVVAFEKVSLWGLPVVEKRRRAYSGINPGEAREIFLRKGLAEGQLKGRYGFMIHNNRLIQQIRNLENRTRRKDLLVDSDVLYHFYDKGLSVLEKHLSETKKSSKKLHKHRKLSLILNERDLARAIRISDDTPLRLSEDSLLRRRPDASELALYPGHIEVAGYTLSLTYRFSPGDEADGVTVTIPQSVLRQLPEHPFEWLVPGLLEDKISVLLKALPKQVRRKLVPIPETARLLCSMKHPRDRGLLEWLRQVLWERFRVRITAGMWPEPSRLPPHFLMRFSVVDNRGREIKAGRNLSALYASTSGKISLRDRAWLEAKKQWERESIDLAEYPDLPEYISLPVKTISQELNVKAYPGIVLEQQDNIAIRLFLSFEDAMKHSEKGLRALMARSLEGELDFLRKNSLPPDFASGALLPFGGEKALRNRIYLFLRRELLGSWEHVPPRSELLARINGVKGRLFVMAQPLISKTGETLLRGLEAREAIQRFSAYQASSAIRSQILKDLKLELHRLLPPDFPCSMDAETLNHLPRRLRALAIRAQRAYSDPGKDATKARRLAWFIKILERARESVNGSPDSAQAQALEKLSFLLDEFRVSVFAPELGTAIPVSDKRLRQLWDNIRHIFPI